MIGNVTMGNYFGGALAYIYKIGVNLPDYKKPVQIETNNVVGNIKQMAWQMAEHAYNSRRLLQPVLHISVSFAPEDNLTQAKEVEAVKAFIKYFGISEEKHQYVIVKHFDSKNSHYHVIANKLNLDNKSLNVDWYKNDAVAIADRVEQELNLFRVHGRTRIFDRLKGEYRNAPKAEREKIVESRQTKEFKDKSLNLSKYITTVRNTVDIVSGYATSLDELKTELGKVNIQATFRIDPVNGSLIGTAFRLADKIRFKGSEIGFSAKFISQRLAENKKIAESNDPSLVLVPTNKTEPIGLLNSKDYYYQYINLGYGKVVLTKQFYFEPDQENERLTKLYIDDAIKLNVTQKNRQYSNAGTMQSKNWIDFNKLPIETGQSQSKLSSNDLEEFKDVFITQENTPDFDDNSIADADKKKKPIIRRKMRR
jgi:hypothetical protein